MQTEELKKGIELVRAGRIGDAKIIFRALVNDDPFNEPAWLWLVETCATNQERIIVLEEYLSLNPGSQMARNGVNKLRSLAQGSVPFTGNANSFENSSSPFSIQPEIVQKTKSEPRYMEPPYVLEASPRVTAVMPTGENKQKSISSPNQRMSGENKAVVAILALVCLLILGVAAVILLPGVMAQGSPLPPTAYIPKPTSTFLPKVIIPPTKTNCECADVNAYLDRVQIRLTAMDSEYQEIDQAVKNSNFDLSLFNKYAGFAKVRYQDQVRDTPPPCLDTFQRKLVTYFNDWNNSMIELSNGSILNASVFLRDLFQKEGELEAEMKGFKDKFINCPGNNPNGDTQGALKSQKSIL